MPGKRRRSSSGSQKISEEEKLSTKLKLIEDERQKKWAEAWDRKLEEEDRSEDCKLCCASPGDFYRKPKIQSNVWVQFNQEKNTQHVQLTFRNLPVPKPKPPILPQLRLSDIEKMESAKSKEKGGKDGKKKKGKNK